MPAEANVTPVQAMIASATVRLLCLKVRKGTSGAGLRPSMRTKTARSAAPASIAARTRADPRPLVAASETPKTKDPTVEFRPVHRHQAGETAKMAEAAESAGYSRLAANHRRVLENLGKVISALETLEAEGRAGA